MTGPRRSAPRACAISCPRPKASISTPWRRCRTIAAAPRPTPCWPDSTPAIKTGRSHARTSGAAAELLEELANGTASSTAGRSSRSTRRSRTRCGGAPSSTRWTRRCSSSSTSGRARRSRPAFMRCIDDPQIEVVGRHHHRGEARDARRDLPAGGRGTPKIMLQDEWGGESSRGWDRVHAATLRAPARQRRCFRSAGCSIADRCPSRATAPP